MMGWRGLPPSQLWLPWQRTAAAAVGSSEEGGGKPGTGGREGMETTQQAGIHCSDNTESLTYYAIRELPGKVLK